MGLRQPLCSQDRALALCWASKAAITSPSHPPPTVPQMCHCCPSVVTPPCSTPHTLSLQFPAWQTPPPATALHRPRAFPNLSLCFAPSFPGRTLLPTVSATPGAGRGVGLRSLSKLRAGWPSASPPPLTPAWAPGAHHEERPLRLAEADDHDQGDAHHGGQSQAPAQPDGPGRVHIHFVVGQGHVLDERKDETSLWRDGGSQRVPGHWGWVDSGARAGPTQGASRPSPLCSVRPSPSANVTKSVLCSKPSVAPQCLQDAGQALSPA